MSHTSDTPVTRDYFLKPGFIYLPEKPTVISTVLGSSVSVSLYDKRSKSGGMNHFLFPFVGDKDKSTALYGNIAIPALIRMMLENGSQRNHLEAQIFGGAHNGAVSDRDIGADNFRTARQILQRKRIKIVSEDVGGDPGPKGGLQHPELRDRHPQGRAPQGLGLVSLPGRPVALLKEKHLT